MGELAGKLVDLFEWFGGKILRNPGPSLCVVIFGLGFGIVGSNAMFKQPSSHPTPIAKMRDATVTHSVVPTAKTDKSQEKLLSAHRLLTSLDPTEIPVPLRKPEPALAADSMVTKSVAGSTRQTDLGTETIVTLQRQLTNLNLYHGEIDGVFGGGTKEAVVRLQALLGMNPDGEIDEELTSLLALSSASNGRQRVAGTAEPESDSVQSFDNGMVKTIQLGLSRFGIDGIDVDGVYGQQTATAIRAFQERYQLTVDGKPTAEVLNKLKTIGAISDS